MDGEVLYEHQKHSGALPGAVVRSGAARKKLWGKTMKLYNFFRSSASYRVRIAMALKGLSYDNASINLAKGEQHQPSYGAVNPLCLLKS